MNRLSSGCETVSWSCIPSFKKASNKQRELIKHSRVVFILWCHHLRVLASCYQELQKGQKSSFVHIFCMWGDPFLLPTPFLSFTPYKVNSWANSRKKGEMEEQLFGSISNLFLIGCQDQRNCTNCSTEWAIFLENTLPGLWLTTNHNKIARNYPLQQTKGADQ